MGTNIIAILIDSPYDRDKIILKINADKIVKNKLIFFTDSIFFSKVY